MPSQYLGSISLGKLWPQSRAHTGQRLLHLPRKTGPWRMLDSPRKARSPHWPITQARNACSNTSQGPGLPGISIRPGRPSDHRGLLLLARNLRPGAGPQLPRHQDSLEGFFCPHSDIQIFPSQSLTHLGKNICMERQRSGALSQTRVQAPGLPLPRW